MSKSTPRRLQLHKETLSELRPDELAVVVAGQNYTPVSVDVFCILKQVTRKIPQTLSCTCNPA